MRIGLVNQMLKILLHYRIHPIRNNCVINVIILRIIRFDINDWCAINRIKPFDNQTSIFQCNDLYGGDSNRIWAVFCSLRKYANFWHVLSSLGMSLEMLIFIKVCPMQKCHYNSMGELIQTFKTVFKFCFYYNCLFNFAPIFVNHFFNGRFNITDWIYFKGCFHFLHGNKFANVYDCTAAIASISILKPKCNSFVGTTALAGRWFPKNCE